MVGDNLIKNFVSGSSGMAQYLMRKVRVPGFDLGRGGRMGIFESVLGILRGRDKILGRLFGKGGFFEKVPNFNQIQKQNLAACDQK